MRRSSFWASTHPSWDISKNAYVCKCGFTCNKREGFNKHVLKKHAQEEARELMSWKDYNKYYGGKV